MAVLRESPSEIIRGTTGNLSGGITGVFNSGRVRNLVRATVN